ncbi:tRNA pseudouridine(38-40) synthase TruA [Paenisporosarcina cavernae]|uniref:tRNA pseudouridine synthase A n=1 Tax=Paenisporosarcina cavernae TaxID=2320858 RepID=A0A385YYZ7_9BACL|nr:tRNA pseudouridine(38-40) synthase TruA [Paenisporosarcina cavernae]AYC30582.1 tRNA pseudouridine(38-40) synthase TruA [Paenisporosarcina cavernae]
MTRWKMTISYDGTDFVGYQIQPNGRTVQEEIENVLSRMHSCTPIRVVASGRTDAGVHASGQVIHFDTTLVLPAERWIRALNSQLPTDIRVLEAETVHDTFHARFDTTGKRYRYKWDIAKIQQPFHRNYAVHGIGTPSIELMKEGASSLIGTHDFSSFCAANTSVKDKVRTIESITFVLVNEELHMVIQGDGFLYNMVRIIAGLLWEVGTGRRAVDEVKEILHAKDRKKSAKTAPAHGLYLEKVFYE